MFKLLVLLFIINLYAQSYIFKYIKKKHDTLLLIHKFGDEKTKVMKTEADIQFITTCKREVVKATFAKVKL